VNALRYVAVGDSYTIGTSVSESERWPNQLVAEVSAARVVAVSTPDYTLTPHGRTFGDLDQRHGAATHHVVTGTGRCRAVANSRE